MSPSTEPRHPVRLVAQRTGLTPHVLRAWERRYGAVSPSRSEGGQRLYSDLDIERLRTLHRLGETGHAIAPLARLTLPELEQLARADAAAQPRRDGGPPVPDQAPAAAPGGIMDEALAATSALDAPRLQAALERAAIGLGVPAFLDQIAGPLLREIGRGWRDGRLGIAHEHFASAAVRRVLGWILRTYEVSGTAPRVVVATPAGQRHELGAMLAAAAAASEGWGVTYLGADLPAEDVLAAARQSRARAVALSALHPTDDPALVGYVGELRQALPAEVRLLIGGPAATAHRKALTARGTDVMEDLGEFRLVLRSIGVTAPGAAP
jgi:DNA-binding transcriptional MerR regulator/methylmalonyl-CoA mutase cobalamin-binding subunit